jgi:hypothetical protein
MPNWKKVIVSGSDASLNTLTVINGITGSLHGTASYALTASYAPNLVISGSINNVDYIDFNTGSAQPAWKSGRVFWDNTDGALAVYNAEQDITLQVGQENWVRVFNASGVLINDGTPVKLVGSHGDVPEIQLAQSVSVSGSIDKSNQIIGLATHDIEIGTIGYVTTNGLVKGLNTNAFSDGDRLFVSSSAGKLTNTPPPAPYEVTPVGVVVKAGPGGSGIIYVSTQQPMDFADLSSVRVSGSYHYGDLWVYRPSGSTGVWEHTNQLSGSYGVTGSWSATSFTGSLLGTSSYASNALSSSFSTTSSYASFALTASNITPAITNNTDNYVLTANGNGTINGESLLQFDGQKLSVLYQAGDEGGEILLGKAATNTSLTGSGITIDVWQNRLRFFEQGGAARGYYLDITAGGAGVGTNLASGAPNIVEIMYFNTNATNLSDNTNYTFTTNTTLTNTINATPGIPLPIGTVVGWRFSTYWGSAPVGSSETGTLKLFWGSGPSEVTLSTAITWDGNRTAVFSGSLSQAITAVEPSWAFVTTPNFATNPQSVKMVLIIQMEI